MLTGGSDNHLLLIDVQKDFCFPEGTLYVAGRTLSRRCPLPRLGGACALAVVLVPDTYEVFMNVVNLQWVVAAGLVGLAPDRSWVEVSVDVSLTIRAAAAFGEDIRLGTRPAL